MVIISKKRGRNALNAVRGRKRKKIRVCFNFTLRSISLQLEFPKTFSLPYFSFFRSKKVKSALSKIILAFRLGLQVIKLMHGQRCPGGKRIWIGERSSLVYLLVLWNTNKEKRDPFLPRWQWPWNMNITPSRMNSQGKRRKQYDGRWWTGTFC